MDYVACGLRIRSSIAPPPMDIRLKLLREGEAAVRGVADSHAVALRIISRVFSR